jgi:hypothetical protein
MLVLICEQKNIEEYQELNILDHLQRLRESYSFGKTEQPLCDGLQEYSSAIKLMIINLLFKDNLTKKCVPF